MKNQLKILGLFVLLLVMSSCKTETHSNPVSDKEVDTTVRVVHEVEEIVFSGNELKEKIMGSWSTNAHPGQVDFNEDGTYKNCEYYNSAAINAETESCIAGTWFIDNENVIIYTEHDTVKNSVIWVFDNVVYLGFDNILVSSEEAWEQGMTKK